MEWTPSRIAGVGIGVLAFLTVFGFYARDVWGRCIADNSWGYCFRTTISIFWPG